MKTAGLILDYYDDSNSQLLKKSFPTLDSLPDIVKEAHILTSEEREVLRDEAFALVMVNDGKVLRKFACVDPGNTFLSALYFSQHADSLPEEAQKIAAANILAFCEDFGLEVRDIEKIAAGNPPDAKNGGAMRKRDSFKQPIAGDDANWSERTNLISVRGGADAGRVIPTANQMKTAGIKDTIKGIYNSDKALHRTQGFAAGTLTAVGAKHLGDHLRKKKDEKKGEQVDFLDSHHKLNPGSKPQEKVAFTSAGLSLAGGAVGGAIGGVVGGVRGAKKDAEGKRHIGKGALKGALKGGAIGAAPGLAVAASKGGAGLRDYAEGWKSLAKHSSVQKVANVIDVSVLSPPILVKKASASRTALGHYPLDSYKDVQAAVSFFDENYKSFSPAQRHEYAVKTAARAEELGITVPPVLERYGSTEFASDVDAHLATRRALAPDFKETWDAFQEKIASVDPLEFAELLSDADEEAELNWLYDGQVMDPFFATFGGNKVKEANAAWSWMSPTGDHVTMDQLKKLARNGRPTVEKQFDASIAAAFSKNPMVIFDSLPDTHKTLLARLANQEFDGLQGN